MKEGARAQTAIEILEELAARGAPADRLMSGYFRKRRFIGSKDRRAVSDIVYGELRTRAALEWWLQTMGLEATPRACVLAWLATGGCWDAGAIATAFDGGEYRPHSLDAPEAALIADIAGKPLISPEMPEAARANCPDALEPVFRAAFGGAFAGEMAALNTAAPVDIRVNTLKATREEARSMLAADGIDAELTPYSPWGLRIALRDGKRVNLAGARAWQDGLIDVQDEASQLAALVTGAAPGMSVLDSCAGAGGKALALAAMMENDGQIFACDTDLDRMRPIAGRAARAGVQIIEMDPLWITEKEHGESKINGREFDIALIDAPCSGTGTWRRNPDARWRLTDEDIAMYAEQQYGILLESAKFVQCGGHLVYATCSVLPEENEAHIERFTDQCSNFRVIPAGEMLRGRTMDEIPGVGPYMRLTPHRAGTDGFFAAVLERTA